jgi:hypothetical protein
LRSIRPPRATASGGRKARNGHTCWHFTVVYFVELPLAALPDAPALLLEVDPPLVSPAALLVPLPLAVPLAPVPLVVVSAALPGVVAVVLPLLPGFIGFVEPIPVVPAAPDGALGADVVVLVPVPLFAVSSFLPHAATDSAVATPRTIQSCLFITRSLSDRLICPARKIPAHRVDATDVPPLSVPGIRQRAVATATRGPRTRA